MYVDILRTFAENTSRSTTITEQARFDASKEQKQFLKAAYLGGYRNLTDFVVRVVLKKPKK